MSLRFRFINHLTNTLILDTPAISATLDFGLSKSTEWAASFPLNIGNIEKIATGDRVEIYSNGKLVLRARVDSISKSFDLTQQLELKGKDDLDELYAEKADSLLPPTNTNAYRMLHLLLRRAGWKIGDISTFVGKDVAATVDLRGEKQLITQIEGVINSLGAYSYRQGATVNGIKTLDIGTFGEKSNIRYVTPPAGLDINTSITNLVQTFSAQTLSTPLLSEVEYKGGDMLDTAGAKKVMTFSDLVANDVSKMEALLYPIIEERYKERYSVVNKFWGKFGGTVEGSFASTLNNVAFLGRNVSAIEVRTQLTTYAFGGKLKYLDMLQSSLSTARPGTIEVIVKKATATPMVVEASNPNPRLLVANFNVADISVAGQARYRVRFDFSSYNFSLDWGTRYTFYFRYVEIDSLLTPFIVIDFLRNAGTVGANNYSQLMSQQGGATWYLTPFRLTTDTEINPALVLQKTSERLTEYAPPSKETNATLIEILAASTAMYDKAVQTLKEKEVQPTEYKLSAVGANLTPKLGTFVYLNTYSESSGVNRVTQTPEVYRNRTEGDFYVQGYRLNFSGNNLVAEYTIIDEYSFRVGKNVVDLYDSAKTKAQFVGIEVPLFDVAPITQYTINLVGLPANDTLNGHPARLVEIVGVGSAPHQTTYRLLGNPTVTASNFPYVEFEMVSYERGDIGTTWAFKIAIDRTWDTGKTATLAYTIEAY